MTLSELSIKRPVLATVLSLVIIFFGVLGFARLGVREYPAVDAPVVTVTTSYGGADPDVIDSQITEPLEQAISGIAGIRTLTSTSRAGRSQIRIEFTLETDIESAANDVRDKVSQAVRNLPNDADPPGVEKADADSDPIIFLAVQSSTKDGLDLSYVADTIVKERLQTIPGVSTIRIFGERRYAMRLWLDPERMAAYDIVPDDVYQAITRENVDLPSGRVEGTSTDITLRTDGRLLTPDDFNALVIRSINGRPVRLADIGRAELGAENMRRANYSSGVPMVGVAIVPQPNTNAVAIADEFYKRLDGIRADLGPDYQIVIGYDFTTFVRRSIAEVRETLLAAFLLVAGIIWLFIRDWRAVIVPLVAIPICIIAGFYIMYQFGFSINVLTLMGLVLAIGLVCDDSIVVLENIHTKVEEGMEPMQAAFEGSREIFFAVIATTIALVAVFMPILFMDGLIGRLFREFGIVIMGCVLISSFVALSLSAMMCSRLLRRGQHGLIHRLTEPFFVLMNSVYRWSLRLFLRLNLLIFPVLAAAIFAIVWSYMNLSSELAPMEDRSNIRVAMRAPEATSYQFTTEGVLEVAAAVEARHGDSIHRAFAITGIPESNQAILNLFLKDPAERTKTAFQILQELPADIDTSRRVRAFPSMPPTIGDRRAGQPLLFVLQAPNVERLQEFLPAFLEEANRHPMLRFADVDLKLNTPQLKVDIDRTRAAELGVSVQQIARAIQLTFGETRLSYFNMDGRQYQVIGQFEGDRRSKPGDLSRVRVRTNAGGTVPLESVASASETISPAALYRYNRFMAATVSASLAPGATLGDGVAAMQEVADKVLPPDFQTDLAGQARDFRDTSSSLMFAFIAAIALVYLVLAAQFESWIDPLIILLTVPLSVSGALLSLWATGQTLNVFSQIGIIMLVGLVTKNGILIVEFANQRKAAGLTPREAALEGAAARFRPILMTSLSTILGILPIAISMGAAAGSRQSLGIGVVGGLTLATVLTLYIVPGVYAFLSPAHRPAAAEAGASDPPAMDAEISPA